MKLPEYTGRHHLKPQRRPKVPQFLRPAFWILNIAIVSAFAVAFASQAKPLN